MRPKTPFESRFWQMVHAIPEHACWEWAGSTREGYGLFGRDGTSHQAHRVAWELLRGPIPGGLTIDHLCRNRLCVNPDHLEPVTQYENTRRGNSIVARHMNQTHCKEGHPLAGDNLIVYVRPNGSKFRRCLICRKVDNRKPKRRAKP